MKKLLVVGVMVAFCLAPLAGYAATSYFGVPNKALGYPAEFGETEAAIAEAEKSPGAIACPEKIAEAKKLAKEAVEIYWACRTEEAMKMLAEARRLAEEAKRCTKLAELRGVHFALGSAKLTAAGKAILDKNVAALKTRSDIRVKVEGHTCDLGTDAYNQNLSERRAKSVYDYLVSKGISPARMKTAGYGETTPAYLNTSEANRSKNRRVELRLY